MMTILDAMADPALFAPWFQGMSWNAWRAFLAAIFGLPLSGDDLETFRRYTGRQEPPVGPAREAWVVVGRRGGKSLIAALVAVFVAFFKDYRPFLAPGERPTVMVIAADRRQARVVFRYICGLIDGVPLLAREVSNQTKESIELRSGVVIEVHTANFRAVRGYTVAAAVLDEVAYWTDADSANPDTEIVAALRPAMATIPGAPLLAISSPYARRGALWEAWKNHYGKDGDSVLVWQAETRAMNSTVEQRIIAEAYEADPAAAAADYGAEFRRDIETFISREAVEAAVVPDRRELPPVSGVRYTAFCDPSGGSQDAMTLAIAHEEQGRAVLDVVRERRPPFSPDDVVREFASVLRSYAVRQIKGDRYGGEWPRERFQKHGIWYDPASMTKSEIYGELLPLVNCGQIELLDHQRLTTQLLSLERRVARGGRESIDHPPGAHDDLANAAAGAVVEAKNAGAVQPRAYVL